MLLLDVILLFRFDVVVLLFCFDFAVVVVVVVVVPPVVVVVEDFRLFIFLDVVMESISSSCRDDI